MTLPSATPVLCFDFDGVICDSCDESAVAAWKHARMLWPDLLPDDNWRPFLAPMRRLRPVVHTGYEQTLLIRLIVEGAPGPDDILARWPEIQSACLARWNLDRDTLIAGFGAVRDRWITEDGDAWIAQHRFYAPVVSYLRQATDPVVVITTKQTRFCALLLEAAGLSIAPERLFGLEAGPKVEVLAALLAGADGADAALHFVEDNPGTLEAVAADPRLDSVSLYLADWGYNTQAMRTRAAAHPRITVIAPAGLASLGTRRRTVGC